MRAFRITAAALVAGFFSLGLVTTSAFAASWTVNAGESALGFKATQSGNEFTGVFENWSADITLDPDNLPTARIRAVIDLASAKTGDRQKDKAMPGKDWFNVKSTPEAVFEADTIEAGNVAGSYIARGTLALRDAEKSVDLPFTLTIDGDNAEASGEVVLIRSDFGVGQGEFATGEWVGLEVTVTVDIAATR